MAFTRVGLIGLSSSAATSWASEAHLPYLLSPEGRSKFQIVALLNSSVKAGQAAIAHYKLPAETRAYGNPADIAADPDVDLVVCNTRVDVHAETIEASILAGKAVFCEWPLAPNSEVARALVAKARQAGNLHKTIVGLQGRVGPVALKIKEVIESGRIGKVLSAEVRAFGGTNDRNTLAKKLDYFLRREVGGNIYTIGVGHRKLFSSGDAWWMILTNEYAQSSTPCSRFWGTWREPILLLARLFVDTSNCSGQMLTSGAMTAP